MGREWGSTVCRCAIDECVFNLCLSLSHGFNGVKQILRFWANVTFSVANITFFSFGDYIFDSGITKSKFVRQSNVLPLKM